MDELLEELREAYGPNAQFKSGQAEAIQELLLGKRLLVVQKTGWGKSLVYFLATRLFRKRNAGITLIISPLLALMNNQIESANKLGVHVETINSANVEDWDRINSDLRDNLIDALIISPERLANDSFRSQLENGLIPKISLFVVDEAHCISDWGHDFRPDYRRIVDIIHLLPSNIPVLATTATANNRVVSDIQNQLGKDIIISRGDLMRDSLEIQIVELWSREERLAWIAENIDSLPGTGIIYCLTVRDCILVNNWLTKKEIACESYYSAIETEEGKNKLEIVRRFMDNEIKALVATVAFGMGFDKPDIGFVIHFQKPANLVAYYQQIGRAGRGIDRAVAVLLVGQEDDAINNYFIDSAFPTETLMSDVVTTILEHPGIRLSEMEKYVNMKNGRIEQCVKYLLVDGAIYKDGTGYYKTPRNWQPDTAKSEEITRIRREELRQMNDFVKTKKCYMKYIAEVLDDESAGECGKCANCLGHLILPQSVSKTVLAEAQRFMKAAVYIITPRKKWPSGITVLGKNMIMSTLSCEQGLVLSNYGDAGWGREVMEGKYQMGFFEDTLVNASYELLCEFVKENDIEWLTSVPSLRRPDLVRNFAVRLAEKLRLPYLESIGKTQTAKCQKELNTSYLQYKNADASFQVNQVQSGNVLLVDDMVDSKWTVTVCGCKLRQAGSGKVYPFALANSAGR